MFEKKEPFTPSAEEQKTYKMKSGIERRKSIKAARIKERKSKVTQKSGVWKEGKRRNAEAAVWHES